MLCTRPARIGLLFSQRYYDTLYGGRHPERHAERQKPGETIIGGDG